jgi:hypothetical protein
MFSSVMFVFAVAAFAWGLSLATYRWLALSNAWPMGVWQAERPSLPRAIGLAAVAIAVLVALDFSGATALWVILFGAIGAFIWTVLLKVGAQSALLLAPLAALLVLAGWFFGGI